MKKNKLDINRVQRSQEFSWWARLGWLIAIWLASVLILAFIALAIRIFMTVAGMST